MEVGRNLLTSSHSVPPPIQTKTFASVLMFHDQSSCALPAMPTTTLARQFPASVLLQEQRDENRIFLHLTKDDKTSQVTLERRRMEGGFLELSESNDFDIDQCIEDFQHRMLNFSDFLYPLPSLQTREKQSLTMMSVPNETKNQTVIEPHNVIALAKKALSASRQAAFLAEKSLLIGADVHNLERSTSPDSIPLVEEKIVRSTRLQERQSRRRRLQNKKVMFEETIISRKADLQRKKGETYDPNDPLRMFLRNSETRQLLTAKEEVEIISKIQDMIKLEKIKSRLESQFDREPTLIEWAESLGIGLRELKSQLHSGKSSREKLIYANFRMVVHIAKQYQGRGLNLHDLMQEGSKGLMISVEKFKPNAGCRFASYAYWWIRQSIRAAIFHHSRTIRLPDSVYNLLYKVTEAKRLCIQDGNHRPGKEDIAARAGITVEKLERLLFNVRTPISLQQPVWSDQDTTFQEVTADSAVETPSVSVAKQLMRQHVRSLLSILSPKERKIIRLRFGIEISKGKSLSEIGSIFGLSKERVRQLESRALYKLKQSLSSQGLGAYADMLI